MNDALAHHLPKDSSFDVAVVGAGAVGMAIAFGLCKLGKSVCVVDEGDLAFRASRGNFGLVWVQGKGARNGPYGRWSMAAASQWPSFAEELRKLTKVDVGLSTPGGFTICLDDRELQARVELLSSMKKLVGDEFSFDVLTPCEARERLPAVSRDIAGAVFCALDRHVSPLLLLRAFFEAYTALGGMWQVGEPVTNITTHRGGGFSVSTDRSSIHAHKVVLAAGLGNKTLGSALGLEVPVRPVRGQILITERVAPFLKYPTLHVRQTSDGTVQIGDSKEEVGFDDQTSMEELSRIASRATRCFPCLSGVNVVRSWGALRVMSQDGYPVYAESSQHPGAFVATCHSGITLAPLHANLIAQWVASGGAPESLSDFSLERFHVQTH